MNKYKKQFVYIISTLAFVSTAELLSKYSKPFDFSKYELNDSYKVDCKEKKACFKRCNSNTNLLYIFFAWKGPVENNLEERIKYGCTNDCAKIVCY